MKNRILVCDDNNQIQFLISQLLEEEGYEVDGAVSLKDSFYFIENSNYDLILLDLVFPDGDGLDLVRRIKDTNRNIPVIIFTGYGSIERAVEAIRLGAYDFVSKNENTDYLLHKIKQAIEFFNLKNNIIKEEKKEWEIPFGNSKIINEILNRVRKIADYDINILITGESGTGKNVLAKYIHSISNRKDKPFQSIDCGAIPENLIEAELFGYEKGSFTGALKNSKGKIELANGGTLFLDEIGNLSLTMQKKLLRLIDERLIQRIGSPRPIKVDVRIIASTNEKLEEKVTEGSFREDLFFRLNEFPIHLPPLRNRREDILPIAMYLLRKHSDKYEKNIKDFSYTVKKIFEMYDWPGNIRELENVIQQSILMSEDGIVSEKDLPDYLLKKFEDLHYIKDKKVVEERMLPSNIGLKKLVSKYESDIIETALETFDYNKDEAARYLKITKKQLNYLMKKYGIDI